MTNHRAETRGLAFGLLAMLGFSLTVPMTRVAVRDFDPIIVGMGRVLISVVPGAFLLIWKRQPFPPRRHWRGLFLSFIGPMIVYPFIIALVLRKVPAAHGAVVVGLLPLATALFATVLGGERPSRGFWLAAVAGSSAVVAFALRESHGQLRADDVWLLVAVVFCGLGYAEGGRLTRELPAVSVLCWGLVITALIVAVPVLHAVAVHGLHASLPCWLAFGYTGVVSMFLAFVTWYRALGLGGVARVSQLQLLQPFCSLAWAALLLGEHLSWLMLATALIVAATVALGRRAAVRRAPDNPAGPKDCQPAPADS